MKTNRNIELQLHARLLAGDPTASADVAATFLENLVRLLRANHNVRDDTIIFDAATDAIMNYSKNPSSFSPSKSSLSTFLYMSAVGDLLNSLKKRKTHSQRELPTDFVELREERRNNKTHPTHFPITSDPNPHQILVVKDLQAKLDKEFPDPLDKKLADLIIQGERDTEAYAELLGITHYPEKQKRKVVKRHKDRINKRLWRMGARLKDDTD